MTTRVDPFIVAPWSDAVVNAANAYQNGPWHPYTCGVCGGQLIATANGWLCVGIKCHYTQPWVRESSLKMGAGT